MSEVITNTRIEEPQKKVGSSFLLKNFDEQYWNQWEDKIKFTLEEKMKIIIETFSRDTVWYSSSDLSLKEARKIIENYEIGEDTKITQKYGKLFFKTQNAEIVLEVNSQLWKLTYFENLCDNEEKVNTINKATSAEKQCIIKSSEENHKKLKEEIQRNKEENEAWEYTVEWLVFWGIAMSFSIWKWLDSAGRKYWIITLDWLERTMGLTTEDINKLNSLNLEKSGWRVALFRLMNFLIDIWWNFSNMVETVLEKRSKSYINYIKNLTLEQYNTLTWEKIGKEDLENAKKTHIKNAQYFSKAERRYMQYILDYKKYNNWTAGRIILKKLNSTEFKNAFIKREILSFSSPIKLLGSFALFTIAMRDYNNDPWNMLFLASWASTMLEYTAGSVTAGKIVENRQTIWEMIKKWLWFFQRWVDKWISIIKNKPVISKILSSKWFKKAVEIAWEITKKVWKWVMRWVNNPFVKGLSWKAKAVWIAISWTIWWLTWIVIWENLLSDIREEIFFELWWHKTRTEGKRIAVDNIFSFHNKVADFFNVDFLDRNSIFNLWFSSVDFKTWPYEFLSQNQRTVEYYNQKADVFKEVLYRDVSDLLDLFLVEDKNWKMVSVYWKKEAFGSTNPITEIALWWESLVDKRLNEINRENSLSTMTKMDNITDEDIDEILSRIEVVLSWEESKSAFDLTKLPDKKEWWSFLDVPDDWFAVFEEIRDDILRNLRRAMERWNFSKAQLKHIIREWVERIKLNEKLIEEEKSALMDIINMNLSIEMADIRYSLQDEDKNWKIYMAPWTGETTITLDNWEEIIIEKKELENEIRNVLLQVSQYGYDLENQDKINWLSLYNESHKNHKKDTILFNYFLDNSTNSANIMRMIIRLQKVNKLWFYMPTWYGQKWLSIFGK